MPQEDGFLTLLSINRGWKDKYTQVKWLWIGVSAFSGLVLGILSWFYFPELLLPASITGTLSGAGLFYIFLKTLPDKQKEKRD
jgi:hypothetical protein